MSKSVKGQFRMEYDQRVIIKFLWNEKTNAHEITQRLQAQFHEEAYTFRTIQFWIGELHRARQDFRDDFRPGRSSLNDFDAIFLPI
jgi:hypothetical protein